VALSDWSSVPTVNGTQDMKNKNYYLSIYAYFGISQSVMSMMITIVMSMALLKASRTLHNNMLSRIMKAPMSFFDTTPIGRIVNRFSSDVQILDQSLPATILDLLESFFRVRLFFSIIFRN